MKNIADTPVQFNSGATMKNRFMLAPLTNLQSHEDGSLSDDEFKWLTMRAEGGFGLVMTCASHVQNNGKGFTGQLGIHSDDLKPGHIRLTDELRKHNCLSVIQLFHAGMRSPKELIGEAPLCPSDNEKYGARGMTLDEVHQLRDNFIQAAVRAQGFGYDGVELHGAHGYILCQFLSTKLNQRTDDYGGDLTNRSRLIFEITEGIRKLCGREFLIGVRLSPERFGMDLLEIKEICLRLADQGYVDFLDISLWDIKKDPEEEAYKNATLLNHFTQLDLKQVKLTVAGKIYGSQDVQKVLDQKVDFVTIGHSGILHHDFPKQVLSNPDFKPEHTPVSKEYLRSQGIGKNFIEYLSRWKGFVE